MLLAPLGTMRRSVSVPGVPGADHGCAGPLKRCWSWHWTGDELPEEEEVVVVEAGARREEDADSKASVSTASTSSESACSSVSGRGGKRRAKRARRVPLHMLAELVVMAPREADEAEAESDWDSDGSERDWDSVGLNSDEMALRNSDKLARKSLVDCSIAPRPRYRRTRVGGTEAGRGSKSIEQIDVLKSPLGSVPAAEAEVVVRSRGVLRGSRKGDRRATLPVASANEYHVAPVVRRRGPRFLEPASARVSTGNRALDRLLTELQTRDITPNDYELLLGLDDSVEKKRLGTELVSGLPQERYGAAARGGCGAEEEVCVVCQVEYEATDMVTVLPACGHRFHVACIERWLGECSTKCPVDNLEVKVAV